MPPRVTDLKFWRRRSAEWHGDRLTAVLWRDSRILCDYRVVKL
jgi:hypothetical protein